MLAEIISLMQSYYTMSTDEISANATETLATPSQSRNADVQASPHLEARAAQPGTIDAEDATKIIEHMRSKSALMYCALMYRL